MIVSMIALSGKKSRLRAVFRGKGLNDMKRKLCYFLLMTALLLPVCAFGEYDAGQMQTWLVRFCEALPALSQQGDPGLTADPARPGEYLLQYAFGTVVAKAPVNPQPEDIIEIQVRTQQVTDCRGMRVGMALQEVTGGAKIGRSSTQLYVLSTQEAGLGFAWAYLGDSGVHGVEYITYGGEDAGVTEYTLTYVLDEQQQVSAIRIRCAPATQAQAQQAMDTAEEIAQRQWGEVYAVRNTESVLTAQDMQVTGIRALGLAAWELVGKLGEPVEVQTLPAGQGRILLYEGAAISQHRDDHQQHANSRKRPKVHPCKHDAHAHKRNSADARQTKSGQKHLNDDQDHAEQKTQHRRQIRNQHTHFFSPFFRTAYHRFCFRERTIVSNVRFGVPNLTSAHSSRIFCASVRTSASYTSVSERL